MAMAIWLKVNRKERQKADLAVHDLSVPEQIAYLSQYTTTSSRDDIIFKRHSAGRFGRCSRAMNARPASTTVGEPG